MASDETDRGGAEADRRVRTTCLLILASLGVGAALYLFRDVFVPFVLALFLAIALMPLVELQMRRLRFPRFLAVVTVLVLSVVVLGLFGMLVSYSVFEFTADPNAYQEPLTKLTNDIMDSLPLEQMGVERKDSLSSQLGISSEAIGATLVGFADYAAGFASQAGLVFILLCFMLFGGTGTTRPLPGTWNEAVRNTWEYIVAKTGISLATGLLTGVVLYICGVPLALVFGLLAFLLNFIPSIGSVIGAVLPLPVILLDEGTSIGAALTIIGALAVVQFVLGNVIEPRVMGKSCHLHPITVMLALILWGILWGVVGMFLAVPITATIRIFLARSERTAPVARLMAGQLDSG